MPIEPPVSAIARAWSAVTWRPRSGVGPIACDPTTITIEANANEEGHLYGSVNANEIAAALKAAGYHITTDQVRLEGPLKELGLYTVKVRYSSEVEGELKVWVVPTVATDAS